MKQFIKYANLYLIMFAFIIAFFITFFITGELRWLLGAGGFSFIICTELLIRLYRKEKELQYFKDETFKLSGKL